MLLLLLAALPGAPATAGIENPPLRVESAWVREAPPVARVLAAYATICNDSARTLTISHIDSDTFARIEMHVSTETGTSTSMRQLDSVTLPSGECVEFAPGGRHFMLFEPKTALRAGDRVAFRFETAEGVRVSATLPVKHADEVNEAEHGHHHGH